MESRKVGTLTLGVVFIVTGIIYLLINIFNLSIDFAIIRFWPLVLISLGVEVLIYNHYSIKHDYKLRFDIISIFLIMVVLVFSFGLYAFGKFSSELLDPSSPLFYKKHVSYIPYMITSLSCIV
ncbi:hypothetical protein HBE96_19350 [Clostridium sp. P21]|uniref:LiaI-LiaF-like transmembrane region domain-containing protein n=1 Tax=Clostridium muellerianum TaxID=2716538 RepID=A0A7Y0EJR9_9CLOT|nr:DUF5668 domain-containing protein [Clostridium muellerianum]NMM64766.1 hypothetical protein [Clostridium muellerianum]